jgi:uncharacterized protein (TIGR00725 family)
VAVVGPSRGEPAHLDAAEAVGRALAERGAVVVCGGLGGAMEAACRGAKSAGGTTVGILPGTDRSAANEFVDFAVATGLGEARNAVIARTTDAVIAVGGAYGTLSEIALALAAGKKVIGLDTWTLATAKGPDEAIERAASPQEAVERALSGVEPA